MIKIDMEKLKQVDDFKTLMKCLISLEKEYFRLRDIEHQLERKYLGISSADCNTDEDFDKYDKAVDTKYDDFLKIKEVKNLMKRKEKNNKEFQKVYKGLSKVISKITGKDFEVYWVKIFENKLKEIYNKL